MTRTEGASFVVGSLGHEPDGATPLEDEDLAGLIPSFVATRADLNVVEFDNISKAIPWARREARRRGSSDMMRIDFLFDLHRRMFGDVWNWAGTQRQRETNLGVAPHNITEQTQLALGDALYWHEHNTYRLEERAVRIHHRLVAVHPFPNGNGRCTRLFADLYLETSGGAPFTWGGASLEAPPAARAEYLAALHHADAGDFGPLVSFARR